MVGRKEKKGEKGGRGLGTVNPEEGGFFNCRGQKEVKQRFIIHERKMGKRGKETEPGGSEDVLPEG